MLAAQAINDVIEQCARSLNFRACVKARRGVDPLVAENLPDHLISARLLIKEHLAGKMTEQMDVEGEARELEHRLFDLLAQRIGRFVPAVSPRKQSACWFMLEVLPVVT